MKRKRVKQEAEEWEVQAVTDSWLKLEYAVRWNDGSSTNEPYENLIPGSEEAVNEFHRSNPGKPNLQDSQHVFQQFCALQTQHATILNENQALQANRLPDAIQSALFNPHQRLVLEENERLKAQCQRFQLRVNEAETKSQHWKARADTLAATSHQAHNQHLMAENAQLSARDRVMTSNIQASEASDRQLRTSNNRLETELMALRSELSNLKKGSQVSSAKFGEAGGNAGITATATPNGTPQTALNVTLGKPSPKMAQEINARVPYIEDHTTAPQKKTPPEPPKKPSTGSPVPRAYYDALAELKCYHCYHHSLNCAYVAGEKCVKCEKHGRTCRVVDRDEDGSYPIPRATVRAMRLKEARLSQANSEQDHSGSVVELVKGADGVLKPKEPDVASSHGPNAQPKAEEIDDGTSLFILEQNAALASVTQPPATAVPPHQPDLITSAKNRENWTERAKIRCHTCYHAGLKCTYIPGQECYQCSRTDSHRQRRKCKPVETDDQGIAPLPTCVIKEARRLRKERDELATEVQALKAAQDATADTWTKQISLLEAALSKHSMGVPAAPAASAQQQCRYCGSTESVGLQEVPKGRLLLCHACGLKNASEGKQAPTQQDTALREENARLKAENIALGTEVEALNKRLATMERAVVGWGAPQTDSGYDENHVDLTAD